MPGIRLQKLVMAKALPANLLGNNRMKVGFPRVWQTKWFFSTIPYSKSQNF